MGLFTTLDFTPALKPWGWARQTFDFLSQKKKGETFAASVGVWRQIWTPGILDVKNQVMPDLRGIDELEEAGNY